VGDPTQAYGWSLRDLVAVLALVGVGVWVTRDAWQDIVRIGLKDEESSHVFLVPIAMLWLGWENRGRLPLCRRVGTWIGPIFLVGGAGLYLYGLLGWARTVTYVGAVLLTLGCLLSVMGLDVLRRFLPVLLALIFVVPVPGMLRQEIAVPLGTTTAKVAEHLLVLFGVPVERSGTLLSINEVDVTIAEACNGLRMVLSLFFVSYVVAFSGSMPWYVRVVVLLGAPVLAIVCNVVRLIPTLCLYGYASREWAERFHDAAGWIMLGISYFGLMGVISLITWVMGSEPERLKAGRGARA
jgi:exosortase